MNIDKLSAKIAAKLNIGRKASKKIAGRIAGCLSGILIRKHRIALPGTGMVLVDFRKTRITPNSDGSFKVTPPSTTIRSEVPSEDMSLHELRTEQDVLLMLTSGGRTSYKEAKKQYSAVTSVIQKALEKGKKVKVTGLGTFAGYSAQSVFVPSGKLQRRINSPFEGLPVKITFPIPPDSLTKAAEFGSISADAGETDDNTFLKKKLALISGDLIKLNEEINKSPGNKNRPNLWG